MITYKYVKPTSIYITYKYVKLTSVYIYLYVKQYILIELIVS